MFHMFKNIVPSVFFIFFFLFFFSFFLFNYYFYITIYYPLAQQSCGGDIGSVPYVCM